MPGLQFSSSPLVAARVALALPTAALVALPLLTQVGLVLTLLVLWLTSALSPRGPVGLLQPPNVRQRPPWLVLAPWALTTLV